MKARRQWVGIAIGLWGAAGVGTAQDEPLRSAAHELTRLSEGVYAVEARLAGANAGLVVGDEGVLVVDSHGTPASARALVELVHRLTDRPVRWVVNTHWHTDHHAGNGAYEAAYPGGVEFISHHLTRHDIPTRGREQLLEVRSFQRDGLKEVEERLAAGLDDHANLLSEEDRRTLEAFVAEQRAFIEGAEAFEFTLPTLTFERSLTLHGRDRQIQVRHFFKGHTRGDVVVYLPRERILFAGDLLTKPILWTWSSYPADYVRTLAALDELDAEQIAIGHGPVLRGESYLRTAREFLEAVVAFARRGTQRGSSAEELREQAGTDETIQSFRRRFVDDPEQDGMFDQMVGWTVDRALAEPGGGEAP